MGTTEVLVGLVLVVGGRCAVVAGVVVAASLRFHRKKLDLVMCWASQKAAAESPLWAQRANRSAQR
jgi:hypothetical protein